MKIWFKLKCIWNIDNIVEAVSCLIDDVKELQKENNDLFSIIDNQEKYIKHKRDNTEEIQELEKRMDDTKEEIQELEKRIDEYEEYVNDLIGR